MKDHKGDVIIDIPRTLPSSHLRRRTRKSVRRDWRHSRPISERRSRFSASSCQGVRFQYRFDKTGRFLVICMNRVHSISDHMFGFVDVVGGPK